MAATLDVGRLRVLMESQSMSQSDLVSRSGVSRAQLSRLLSKERANVRESTILQLARGLSADPSDLTVGGHRRIYLEWVIKQHEFIDFRGIGMPHFQRQPIEDVFVEPDVELEDVGGSEGDDCGQLPEGLRWRESKAQQNAASESVRKSDRLVVVGNPGNGKTTLLRWLAFRAARGDLADTDTPIYVRLAEFSRALEIDPATDLLKFISSMAARAGCRHFEQELRSRLASSNSHCLVLLDGLDEVGDRDRRDLLVKALVAFLDQYPRNRFVLTSRIVGFERSPWISLGFSTVRLLGYGHAQLVEFSRKWSKLLARVFGRTADDARASLSSAVFDNPRVRALASNPLVLTILALLNESRGGALPRRRVDLYAKVAEVFLETWERTKQSTEGFDETSDIDLDGREFGWLLSDMALAMQKNNRTLAAKWWLNDRIQDCLREKLGFEADQAKDIGERVLRYVTVRTGLIEERGIDQFGFSHRTLQEYFAAMGVMDEADASPARDVSDRLLGYFFNPQWTEVVRLVAASVTPPVAEAMISTILDDPDPIGRDILRRGPLLALRCLSDGATVPNRRLVATVFDSLTVLGRSKWLGITFEALDILGTFEGTRLEAEAKRAISSILETAERDLSLDEFACLYQHANWKEVAGQIEKELGNNSDDAARELTTNVVGRSISIVYFNASLRVKEPRKWFKSVCSLVQDERGSKHFRQCLIRELGGQIETHVLPRRALRKLVESTTMPAELRAEAAEALATSAGDSSLLLRALRRDDEDLSVRQACASSLRNVAASDARIAAELLKVLNSDEPANLRAGAARGLGKLAITDQAVARTLIDVATRESTPDRLKCACLWGLEKRVATDDHVKALFEQSLTEENDPKSRRVAAQVMAHCMSDESLDWDPDTIETIETILINLSDPCPHALDSLFAIATAREVRCGLRLENVIREAIKSIEGHVDLAFVFGSTARRQQTPDSDIDLMVIGDVTHKMLATPLRKAERTLGRRINPVLNSRLDIQRKYHAGEAFVLDVFRREKIPVWPAGKSKREFEDDFRAMVSERLASTG